MSYQLKKQLALLAKQSSPWWWKKHGAMMPLSWDLKNCKQADRRNTLAINRLVCRVMWLMWNEVYLKVSFVWYWGELSCIWKLIKKPPKWAQCKESKQLTQISLFKESACTQPSQFLLRDTVILKCFNNGYRAVANGQVGWVLARPIFAPEETTPIKLTFATVLSFAKGSMFIAFLVFVNF